MMWLSYLLLAFLLLVGMLLIFIILLQRGRGGGLAGALGGMGGQSAFGTKAGDLFTRITVVLAVIWIILCAGQIPLIRAINTGYEAPNSPPVLMAPAQKDDPQLNFPANDGAAAKTEDPAAKDETPQTPGNNEEGAKSEEAAPKTEGDQPKVDEAEKPATDKPANDDKKEAATEPSAADSEKKPE